MFNPQKHKCNVTVRLTLHFFSRSPPYSPTDRTASKSVMLLFPNFYENTFSEKCFFLHITFAIFSDFFLINQ